MIQNLTTILCGEAEEHVVFPSEDEIMDLISQSTTSESVEGEHALPLRPNQTVAVIWDSKSRKK